MIIKITKKIKKDTLPIFIRIEDAGNQLLIDYYPCKIYRGTFGDLQELISKIGNPPGISDLDLLTEFSRLPGIDPDMQYFSNDSQFSELLRVAFFISYRLYLDNNHNDSSAKYFDNISNTIFFKYIRTFNEPLYIAYFLPANLDIIDAAQREQLHFEGLLWKIEISYLNKLVGNGHYENYFKPFISPNVNLSFPENIRYYYNKVMNLMNDKLKELNL
ncbi:hypothetical protein [Leptospira kmetyi]|uniref:hypothetical protein n=1 Tax=Leptospira kmetyi TaxID=408139 RepID=UPI003EBD5582